LSQIESNFDEFISGSPFGHLGKITKKYIYTKQDEGYGIEDFVELGTEPANNYLADLVRDLREEAKTEAGGDAEDLDENAFPTDAEFNIRVMMVFKELPKPESVWKFIKEFTSNNSNWAEIYIPALGICGSYENGEEDESNLENFVPDEQED
jgi:hypothetical protein